MEDEQIIIDKQNIIFNSDANSTAEVIRELADTLFECGHITDIEKFMDSVFEREREIPTSIGNGIAIPHGKSDVVLTSKISLAVLKKPIVWDGSDDEVKYIFLLAIKDGDQGDNHLRTLANLASRLMDDEFVEMLKGATNINELSFQ
ncbi:PTS sugar transporter subunit IIA [Aerococcus sp. HMSC10H05]|uniref:PTS sugar transporter subunit IIA n=1 Tax=Aerococcus sp. HMSC10H05 TaxID=1581084 RepID=UPI0008A18354|nr:PTS sugar transporter subunit IIA [Aerococcus sp. HMSC10H05]OFU53273.1 hypothetical protein HMPREF3116_00880 [Aerococcus sp. HMSC10H05]